VATPEPSEPLSEDWETALAVVAHPDDLEFGGAAAVALWTNQGKRVVYCLLTSGEAGIDGTPPEQSGPLRESEQRESARNVGVDEVEFLGLPGGVLEYGVPLRREIAPVVRRYRPQVVLTNDFKDRWAGSANLNQANHIACGKATLDAVRDAGNRWVFGEQVADEGLEKWGGVREVWVSGSPCGPHAVDITDTFEVGVESLRAHKAYIGGLGWEDFDPAEFLEGLSRQTGTRLGVPMAVGFDAFNLGWA
jgi:LmbE family N-acetylglucosaminyl deacetylase